MQLNKVIEGGRREVRDSLSQASRGAKPAQLDKLVNDVFTLLSTQYNTPAGIMQGVMTVVGNIEALGEQAVNAPATKLVQKMDPAQLRELLEAEADERAAGENLLAESATCEVCGLPKAGRKLNLNRQDVEDEVHGQQYDAVFSDLCRCYEVELERQKAQAKEDEKNKIVAGANLALLEEQDEDNNDSGAKAKVAGERRERPEK